MYRPAKSMPLNASVPRACASCTPRCLNGPFIAQSPAENTEPNTVGKLEGNTILPLVGMTLSRKGKARRVFQSQPIGQTLFPGRCRCSAPSLRARHWQKEMDPCLCIELLVRWYFVIGSVQEEKICQHHAKMLDLNICRKRGCREEQSTFMTEGTPPKKHTQSLYHFPSLSACPYLSNSSCTIARTGTWTPKSLHLHVWGIQQGVARVQETLCGLTFKIQ